MRLHDTMSKKLKSKNPRRLLVIKPSKYEFYGAIHANKDYWNSILKEPENCLDEPVNSTGLLEVLPTNVYEKVCNLLDLPPLEPEQPRKKTKEKSTTKLVVKEPVLMTRRHIHIERAIDSDTDVEVGSKTESNDDEDVPANIHLNLLKKPERDQITWNSRYLQPEEEHEKNLVKKADDLTEKIAQEFCIYMKELGGNQQSQLLTPNAIKELFQIEFDTHVARGLQVVPKELPVVEENLAAVTGHPEMSKFAALERMIHEDIRAENTSDVTQAFGRCLDIRDQWRVPRNDTKSKWQQTRHIPKDLITLKTVWEGITNLKSVKEYCRWMIEHPEHEQPLYLKSLGMFDPGVLEARLTMDEGQLPAPGNVFGRPSQTHRPRGRRRH